MKGYDSNRNQVLPDLVFENAKEAEKKYFQEHPDSLILPFEQELRNLGFQFEISSQINQFMPKHKKIILPIAIKYYEQAKYDNEKNFFISLFHFKGFDEVVPLLIKDFFEPTTSEHNRWFIADCLYQISSKQYMDDYIKIISDSAYGINRQMIILLVGKLKSEKAIPVLIELLEDESVRLQAIAALGYYKREEFRPYFEKFQNSKHSGWRKYAKAALKKLDY